MSFIHKNSVGIAGLIIGSAFVFAAYVVSQHNQETQKRITDECAQEPGLRFGYILCGDSPIKRLELKSSEDNALDLLVYTDEIKEILYLLSRGPNKNDLVYNPNYTHTDFNTISNERPYPYHISAMTTGDINGDGLTDLIVGTYEGDVIAYQGISK